jgi:hypothetical protein
VHLVAAQKAVTLMPTQEINLYTSLLASGQIQLFFGYQLPNGVIVFNGEQAIELVVGKLGGGLARVRGVIPRSYTGCQ